MRNPVCAASSPHSAGILCGDEASIYAAVHLVRADARVCTCARMRARARRRERARGNVGAQAAQVAQANDGAASCRSLPAHPPAPADLSPHSRTRLRLLNTDSQKEQKKLAARPGAATWFRWTARVVIACVSAIRRVFSSSKPGAGDVPRGTTTH